MRDRAAVALAACLASCAGSAWAIFGFGDSDVTVRTVDAASGAPVAGASVLAAERLEWHEFHSTRSQCAATSAATSDAGGEATLHGSGGGSLDRPGTARLFQVIAYRPGYCAGILRGSTRLQGGDARMTPSTDPAEPRLRYLALIARQAASACPEAGNAWIARFREVVLAESSRLASSPLEKLLAVRVEEAFDLTGRPKTLRTVLHGYAMQGNVGGMEQMLAWAKADPFLAKGFCPPGQSTCMMPMPDPARMPREEPFRIDERDEQGFSALMAAARAMKPDSTRWLLEHGADVNVLTGPGGYSALDLVLSRARDDVREEGPEGLESHLLRMIALLATGHARPTLNARYREDLAADPASWTVGPRLRKFWSDVRERVIGYDARAPLELACAIAQPARASLELRGPAQR